MCTESNNTISLVSSSSLTGSALVMLQSDFLPIFCVHISGVLCILYTYEPENKVLNWSIGWLSGPMVLISNDQAKVLNCMHVL